MGHKIVFVSTTREGMGVHSHHLGVTTRQNQWQAGQEAWEPGIEVAVSLGQVLEGSASQGGCWRDQEVQGSS